MNDILWESALRRAEEELPEYRFYIPGGKHYRAMPADLYGVTEHPWAPEPNMPGVHKSFFTWPRRDSFSYATAPLTPNEVVTRLDDLALETEEDTTDLGDDGRQMHSRRVRLCGGRDLRARWESTVDDRPFEKSWPPTPASVLEALAREAVRVDDGRTEDQWLVLLDPKQREHFVSLRESDETRPMVTDIFEDAKRDAWKLYRFLGVELYEGLTAAYRQPLAAALFTAANVEERAEAEQQRLRAMGQRLRSARTELGMTVEHVVELTGLAKARVVAAERGGGALKVTDLLALASLYRLPAEQLLAPPEPEPES